MIWKELQMLNKFNSINEVFEKIGNPVFKFEDKPFYYVGRGFFIAYCNKKYFLRDNVLNEIGVEGQYITKILFFINKSEAELYFKNRIEQLEFFPERIGEAFEIHPKISLLDPMLSVMHILKNNKYNKHLMEGITQRLNEKRELTFC